MTGALPFDPAQSATGFVVGTLVGMTGVGGGSLMTPALILLFGIHPVTAVGTDLLQAAASKAVGSAVHGRRGSVDWRLVGHLLTGSLPAALLTLLVIGFAGVNGRAVSHAVSGVLGVALLGTAASLLFRPAIARWARNGARTRAPARRRMLTIATGAVVGALVTLSSVGAGAIGVTALLLLYPELPTVRIVGSDIAHAVPLTLVAGGGHVLLGTVDWPLLASLLAGSVPGIVLGSLLATRLPDGAVRGVLASVLVLVGSRLVH